MVALTERAVKNFGPPTSRANEVHYDDALKGFGLRITAKGTKSFVLNYRVSGRERRYTIGKWPTWSVVAARREAQRLRQDIDRGEDPLEMRETQFSAPTVADLFERYNREHLRDKAERAASDARSMWRTYVLPKLGNKKVGDIRHSDIDRLHSDISKAKPVRANRVIEVVRTAFNLAMRWEWIEKNPATGVRKNHEEARDRYLTKSELPHVTRALAEHPERVSADAITLMLLTGCRRGEALSATWAQFDLERGIWNKPSSHTKQRKRHRIPLAPVTVELLRSRLSKSESEFVFPSSSRSGHLTDVKRTWDTVRRHATMSIWCEIPRIAQIADALEGGLNRSPSVEELEAELKANGVQKPPSLVNVRIHDLRHTYASSLVSSGHSLSVIGGLLGHSQTQTTLRYAHLYDDPLRAAAEAATTEIGIDYCASEAEPKGRETNDD